MSSSYLRVWWYNNAGSYYTRLKLHNDGRLIIPLIAVCILILPPSPFSLSIYALLTIRVLARRYVR